MRYFKDGKYIEISNYDLNTYEPYRTSRGICDFIVNSFVNGQKLQYTETYNSIPERLRKESLEEFIANNFAEDCSLSAADFGSIKVRLAKDVNLGAIDPRKTGINLTNAANLIAEIFNGSGHNNPAPFNAANAKLAGLDFNGVDIRGLNFSGTDLTGANLSNCQADYAYFRNAKMDNVDISGTSLFKADLRGAKVTGARSSEKTNLLDCKLPSDGVYLSQLQNTQDVPATARKSHHIKTALNYAGKLVLGLVAFAAPLLVACMKASDITDELFRNARPGDGAFHMPISLFAWLVLGSIGLAAGGVLGVLGYSAVPTPSLNDRYPDPEKRAAGNYWNFAPAAKVAELSAQQNQPRSKADKDWRQNLAYEGQGR